MFSFLKKIYKSHISNKSVKKTINCNINHKELLIVACSK